MRARTHTRLLVWFVLIYVSIFILTNFEKALMASDEVSCLYHVSGVIHTQRRLLEAISFSEGDTREYLNM